MIRLSTKKVKNLFMVILFGLRLSPKFVFF